jgi:hypothetical protein
MLGYPGEREEDSARTQETIVKNDFDFVYFNDFQPGSIMVLNRLAATQLFVFQ